MMQDSPQDFPQRRGKLYVISAASGAGKTTICRALRREGLVRLSVSHTTRPPREGERDGEAYFFVERGDFMRLIDGGAFLEWAEVYGHLYGTSAAWVEGQLADGRDVLLEIDCQGARQIKEKHPQTVMIFVKAPDAETLRRRLLARGKDDDAVVERRLRAAEAENKQESAFDHVIINDRLQRAVDEIRAVMTQEHAKEHAKNGQNNR